MAELVSDFAGMPPDPADQALRGVDLAREADFRLGGLEISPSSGRARWAGGEQRLEPRVMEVLVVLARRAGETVSRDELIDACWAGRTVSEDAVNRVLAQVRSLARNVTPQPFTLETIPKVGFRLLAREAADFPRAGPAPARRLAIWLAAVTLASAAIAGWTAWLQGGSANPAYGKPVRVDVVAFESRRNDPELRRLAAASSQALVQRLLNGGVHTREHPISHDAGDNGGEFRIVGWLDRRGPNVTVDTQLIDRASGQVLWSGRDEKPAALGDDLAQGAGDAAAFIVQCSLQDRRASRVGWSTDVLALYMAACDGLGAPERMVAAGRRLVAAAPKMAGGHAMLAIGLGFAGQDESRPDAAALRAEGLAEANRALALDPRWAKAYLGRELSRGRGHWSEREADLQRSIALDPALTPPFHLYLLLLNEVGRMKEAIAIQERAVSLRDPRTLTGALGQLAILYAASGDLGAADRAIQDVGASDQARFLRWNIAVFWRDPAEGLVTLKTPGEGPRDPATRACLVHYLTELAAQKTTAVRLRGLPAECGNVHPSWRPRLLAREGDLDGAFALLEAHPLARDATQQLFYSDMKRLRADPRFMPFAARIGLVDYWRRSGHWPDFCLAPDRPYDCQDAARGL